MTGLIAITGATGALGGRIARRLATQGIRQRLVVRDPGRAPDIAGAHVSVADYADAAAMRSALDGVDTLLLVSATESVDRTSRHLTAIDTAIAAGVTRVVYTSFVGAAPDATFTLARDHWATEEHLRSSTLAYSILRDNLYLDAFAYFVDPDGIIRGPAGDGRVGAVARDDIADAAVAVLATAARTSSDTRTPHDGQLYHLTGPQALTLAEVAQQLSRFSGRDIRYQPETLEEAYASRAHHHAPDWQVRGWISSYQAIAAGEMETVTDDVARLTGHRPMSLADLLTTDHGALNVLRHDEHADRWES